MKNIDKNYTYLLGWKNNPSYWNKDISRIKALAAKNINVIEKCGKYYTIVQPHCSGKFGIVDCTCNNRTGDYYPINTSLLTKYEMNEDGVY